MPERPERLRRAGAALADAGVEALLVTHPANVRYLTGYSGSNGAVVVRPDGATFLTDFRYGATVEPYRSFVDVVIVERDLLGTVGNRLAELTAASERVGFEPGLAWGEHERIAEAAPELALVPVAGTIEELRLVKSPTELAAIRHAMDELERVYALVAEAGLVGRTERDVAWSIERAIREAGFPALSFEPIVAAGGRGGTPHAVPQDIEIQRGELVVVDIGAQGESGYCSDCTRTFAAGGPPEAAAREDYELVLAAQLAGLRAVRAGVSGVDADAAARAVIEEHGDGKLFGHGLGHGIGLEVHEAPTLRPTATDVLEAGNVCSVEPGIYRPGQWGVRIEDAVVVTDEGCDVLTAYPKDLVETN